MSVIALCVKYLTRFNTCEKERATAILCRSIHRDSTSRKRWLLLCLKFYNPPFRKSSYLKKTLNNYHNKRFQLIFLGVIFWFPRCGLFPERRNPSNRDRATIVRCTKRAPVGAPSPPPVIQPTLSCTYKYQATRAKAIGSTAVLRCCANWMIRYLLISRLSKQMGIYYLRQKCRICSI